MLLKGVATLVSLKRSVTPTEEDRQEFVKAVLTNKPFIRTYTITGTPIKVTCTSPNSKEYVEFGKRSNEDSDFENIVVKSVLQEVTIDGKVIYKKEDVGENWEEYFQNTLGQSPLQVLVLEKVVIFYNTFIKLLQEMFSSDFFGKTSNTEQS